MAFPTTSILDDFNRADEGPPLSVVFGWADVPTVSGCQIVSNECAGSIDIQWENLQHWGTPTGDDCEVYFTVTSLSSPSGIHADLIARHQIGDSLASYDQCYRLTVNNGIAGQIDLYAEDGGHVLLGQWPETPADPFLDGASFGISCIGSTISAWYKPPAGSWSEVISVTDATWSDGGYIGFDIRRLPVTVDDFGGGTIAAAGPTAAFSGTPLSGPAPLSVDFTDESTGTPTSWAWDFDDGDTSTEQNPTHVFTSPGTYTIALTATNDDGSDTETKVDYVTVLGPPVADFSGTPTSGTVALSVDFTDASTNTPDTWSWDFGDGGSSTSQNPTHVYNYIGVYTVTLTASSTAGSDSETKVDYITVTAVEEFGAAEIENCDIDTGGAAVGLRVSDVAIARDNILGSVTIDASAELRAKDNAYSTLVNNGTLQPLAGDRAVWDVDGYPARHASDIDGATFGYHNDPADPPLSAALTDGHIFVGNVSNIAADVAMSGDATIINTGALTLKNTGPGATGPLGGATVAPIITIDAQGRVTALTSTTITGVTPAAHQLDGALHTVSGLTPGDVLTALTASTFGFTALATSGGVPQVYNETATGDGSTTTFYLANYANPSTIRVYIDGIRQAASDDTDPTDAVVFSPAPFNGASLLFDYELYTA